MRYTGISEKRPILGHNHNTIKLLTLDHYNNWLHLDIN